MGWFSSSSDTETKRKYKCTSTGSIGEGPGRCGKRHGPEVPVDELPDKGYQIKFCDEHSSGTSSSHSSTSVGGVGAGNSDSSSDSGGSDGLYTGGPSGPADY